MVFQKTIEKESNKVIVVTGIFVIKVGERGGRIEDDKEGKVEIELGYDFNPDF